MCFQLSTNKYAQFDQSVCIHGNTSQDVVFNENRNNNNTDYKWHVKCLIDIHKYVNLYFLKFYALIFMKFFLFFLDCI